MPNTMYSFPEIIQSSLQTLGFPDGVAPSSIKELNKRYHLLALKHHPDKGGNEDDFKAISRAHDVLADDRKRQVYDMTGKVEGEAGAQEGGGHPFGNYSITR